MSDAGQQSTDLRARVALSRAGIGPATAAQAAAVAAAAESIAAQAAAGIAAEAAAVAEVAVDAAAGAAARAAARASHTAAAAAAEMAAEIAAEVAAEVAAEAVVVAAAVAAAVVRAAAAAADVVRASHTADARATPATQIDLAARSEWATFVAEPRLPGFAATRQPDTALSFAAPGERGLWRDIALARRLEAALRASEAHFEAAFDAAPTALLITSLEGGRPARFLRVNRALARLTGYPRIALLDRGFADLESPEPDPPPQNPASAGWLEDGKPDEQWVRRWVHADGHDLWVRIRMAGMRLTGSPVEHLVCQIEPGPMPCRGLAHPDLPAAHPKQC